MMIYKISLAENENVNEWCDLIVSHCIIHLLAFYNKSSEL